MNRSETDRLTLLAQEAMIRRAAQLQAPMMLKGSFVSRMYFPSPEMRHTADLDWIYLDHIPSGEAARAHFTAWVTAVTSLNLDDGVQFRDFQENAFWRYIDYAMADDFPTVNTDLDCTVYGTPVLLRVDITYNLPMTVPAIPLSYRPLEGPDILYPLTPPLSLQVAWKLHQCLTGSRLKDFIDLYFLLQHPDWNAETTHACLLALLEESAADRIPTHRIQHLLEGEFYEFRDVFMERDWDIYRYGDLYASHEYHYACFPKGSLDKLPHTLVEFWWVLTGVFYAAGLPEGWFALPPDKRQ